MKFLKSLFFILTLFLVTVFGVQAQDSRSGSSEAIFGENSSGKAEKKSRVKGSKRKSSKNSFNKNLDKKVEETEKRLEQNRKRNRKRAKQMEKPQYSDPSYFGHKKKPKKRPPGKQKFCKECGIKH